MKIHHIIPLLLLAGGITVGAQPTNFYPRYTLIFDVGQRGIANPTEADIRSAVTGYKGQMGPIFQISMVGTKETLQIDALGDGHYSFEYSDGGKVGYISKRKDYSIEEAVKILTDYRYGSPIWNETIDWKERK